MNELRAYLQNHPSIVMVGCALLVAAFFGISFLLWPFDSNRPIEYQKMVYFYDLNEEKLYPVPAGTFTPQMTDSGLYKGMPAGVKAEVLCCGNYSGDDDYFIGLFEVATEAVPEDQRPKGIRTDTDRDIFLVRRPDEENWHSVSSREFNKIMKELRERCPEDKPLENVYPAPVPIE